MSISVSLVHLIALLHNNATPNAQALLHPNFVPSESHAESLIKSGQVALASLFALVPRARTLKLKAWALSAAENVRKNRNPAATDENSSEDELLRWWESCDASLAHLARSGAALMHEWRSLPARQQRQHLAAAAAAAANPKGKGSSAANSNKDKIKLVARVKAHMVKALVLASPRACLQLRASSDALPLAIPPSGRGGGSSGSGDASAAGGGVSKSGKSAEASPSGFARGLAQEGCDPNDPAGTVCACERPCVRASERARRVCLRAGVTLCVSLASL